MASLAFSLFYISRAVMHDREPKFADAPEGHSNQ